VRVYNCDIEMHIGGQNNLDNNLIATVIIGARKHGVGVTNFFEDIAKLVKEGYLDKVVIPKHGPIHDRIRWIERNHYPRENYEIVSLAWDSKAQRYHTPNWSKLDEKDWIYKNNKMEPYK
jgi:hypothetical protein